MIKCNQANNERCNFQGFRIFKITEIEQESKVFLAYIDEKRRIDLIRYASKFIAMIYAEGQEPREINLNIPKYFETIPDDKVSIALRKHGKNLIKNENQVVSLNVYPLLLGGGQVSSKLLSGQPVRQNITKSNKSGTDTKIEDLNQQIADVNMVLQEWRNKYKELQEAYKTSTVEKLVEVPIEIVKVVEKPVIVEKNSDVKLNELQNQIDSYEKRILDWKRKFYIFNDELNQEQALLQSENTIEQTRHEMFDDPQELVIEDERDNRQLKVIRDKIRNLQQFSRDLQRRCLSTETRTTYNQIPVNITTYTDRPVETVVYNNDILDSLKEKVFRLNDNVLEWQNMYNQIESSDSSIKFEIQRADRKNYQEIPQPIQNVEEIDDGSVNMLKAELDILRQTLTEWQSKVSVKQDEVVIKRVEVPVEVVKYVERPIESVRYDESRANEIQSQITEVYQTIEEWKRKYQSVKRTTPQIPIVKGNTVDVENSNEVREDERIQILSKKVEDLREGLTYWESLYKEVSSREQQVYEKEIRIEKPVTRFVEKPVTVYVHDDEKLQELRTKIAEAYKKLEQVNTKHIHKGKVEALILDKTIEIPNEKVSVIERKVQKVIYDEERIKFLIEHLNELQNSLVEWEEKCSDLQNKEYQLKEVIQTIPIEVIKYVDHPVYVDVVDEERYNIVYDEYQKLKETIDFWQNKYSTVQRNEVRVIEKIVEVPIEVVQYIDVPVEVPVVDEVKLAELNDYYNRLYDQYNSIKREINTTKVKKTKYVDRYNDTLIESVEAIEVEIPNFEIDQHRINDLQEEIENLTKTLEEYQGRYEELAQRDIKVEKIIREVPIDVFEFIDRDVEHRVVDQSKAKILEDEYNRLLSEIEETKQKHFEYERIENRVITKVVEIPVERIEYVDKVIEVVKVDQERLRQLKKEYFELNISLNNWKNKFEVSQRVQQKVIERIIEVPVETIEVIENEMIKVKVDEKRIRELSREYDRLTNSIDSLKEQFYRIQQRDAKIIEKTVEIPVEIFEYVDQKKDVFVQDEALFRELDEEIQALTKQYSEITSRREELEINSNKIIEKRVEVANEVENIIEIDIERVEVDENRINALLSEIEDLNYSIRQCQERYNLVESEEIKIINDIEVYPVQIAEFQDTHIQLNYQNEDAVDHLKTTYNELTVELNNLQLEIQTIERNKGIVVDKVIRQGRRFKSVLEREIETIQLDEEKFNRLRVEYERLNERLTICNTMIREIQENETQVEQVIVEKPYERIVYVDIDNQVFCVDQERIDILSKRVAELEIQVKNKKPFIAKKKGKRIELKDKYIDEPVEIIRKIETTVEEVLVDQNKFDRVKYDYNILVDELRDWKIKFIELENQEPRIEEVKVVVPIEKIVYVDVPVDVLVEDTARIEELTAELESLRQSSSYWESKLVEIETVNRRVVDKYIDEPVEIVQYYDAEVEVIKVDEERIKQLSELYENYSIQLQRVKYEYSMLSKSEPVIIEKIVEIPFEVVEEIQKVIEVKVVDQEKLKALSEEYTRVVESLVSGQTQIEEEDDVEIVYEDVQVEKIVEKIEYVDVYEEEVKEDYEKIRDLEEQLVKYTTTSDGDVKKHTSYVKLPPTIVEKRVEVPYEVIKYIDEEVQVVRRNDVREKELLDQINATKDKIRVLQDQYDRILKTPQQIVKKVIEIPIERTVYVDTPIEVIKYDNSKINYIENNVNNFRNTLIHWLGKYKDLEQPEDMVMEVKAIIPAQLTPKSFNRPDVKDDDDSRLKSLQLEISEINKLLVQLSSNFKKIEQTQQRIVEIPVEVPVEIIKFVDRPYEVVVQDDRRIHELEYEIHNLQRVIDEYSSMKHTSEYIQEVHQSVKVPSEVAHVTRPKEVYQSHDNIVFLDEQIQEIYNKVSIWKNKYKELSKRERQVIETIVEIPIEVIKYVDVRVETIKQDDQRIQTLEKELNVLAGQFGEWQTIFTETNEFSILNNKKFSIDQVIGQLENVIKPDGRYLEIQSKINSFSQEFSNLRKNVEMLEKMERIIINKVVEVPREVAEIIEYHIETEDYRPKQYLRQLEALNSKIESWKKGIQTKVQTSTGQIVERKLNYQENFVDNTPILIRDNKFEIELEQELLEITKLIQGFEEKAIEIEVEKQEVFENVKRVYYDVEKVIFKDIIETVKEVGHEETLENLIRETTDAINQKKSQFKTNKTSQIEIIEKVIKVREEILKEINRNIEIPRYNDDKVVVIMSQYSRLVDQFGMVIQRFGELEKVTYETVEKVVKVNTEVIKTVERQVGVKVNDEKPIIEIMQKINELGHLILEARNEHFSIEAEEEEIIENIINRDKYVPRLEITRRNVVHFDNNPIKDLEFKRDQLLERVHLWQSKVVTLEQTEEQVIEKVMEIPVKNIKTYLKSYGEIVYNENPMKELAQTIMDLNIELRHLKNDLNSLIQTKTNVEEKFITNIVEKVIRVDNIIEKVKWDDTEIRDLEKKIKEISKQISQYEDKTNITNASKKEIIEKVTKVYKEVKKYVINDIEKVVINEEPIKELEADIQALNEVLSSWKDRLTVLKNEKINTIEKIVEVEKVYTKRVNRIVEIIKTDEKALQIQIEKINKLKIMIEEANSKISILERRKLTTVEKNEYISVDVNVFKVATRNVTLNYENTIIDLEERKQRLIEQLSEWQNKVYTTEQLKEKFIKRKIEFPSIQPVRVQLEVKSAVYDELTAGEWEAKCDELRNQLKVMTKKKIDVTRENTKIIQKERLEIYDVVTYEDRPIQKLYWDDEAIINMQKQIEITNQLLVVAEQKKRDFERKKTNVLQNIIEVPKEVIKKVERKVDRYIWDDSTIISLQEKIKELVNKLNEGSSVATLEEEDEVEYKERVIKVPRESIKYEEVIVKKVIYDDSPINEISKQIAEIKLEIQEWKNKVNLLGRKRDNVIKKVTEVFREIIVKKENYIENIRFDDNRINELKSQIDALKSKLKKSKSQLKVKNSQREEVFEREIKIRREIVKRVDRIQEIVRYDNTTVNEIEGKLNKTREELNEFKNLIKQGGNRQPEVMERTVHVKKEVKIFKEVLVEKVYEDIGPLLDMETRIRTARSQVKSYIPEKQVIKKKRQEVRDNIIEVVREVIKKVERPIKYVKYDDTRVNQLQQQINQALISYHPNDHEIHEIIEEEGDVIEKLIEIPVKQIKEVQRTIEKVIWDDSLISLLENQLKELQAKPDELYRKIELLIDQKNEVVEEVLEKRIEVIKYIPREYEVIKVVQGGTDVLDAELENSRKSLELIIEQYNDLKNSDRQYVYNTIEVPYETVKYVDVPVEVYRVDQDKIDKLEKRLQRLKKVESEIEDQLYEVEVSKSQVIKRQKNIPVEVLVAVDRPVRTLRVDLERLADIEDQLMDATRELTNWKSKCEEYDIIKERIIEVPVELVKEVNYPVEVHKVHDDLVVDLAYSVSAIKNVLYELEAKHELLMSSQNQVIEKIIEQPYIVEKQVDREIQVVIPDHEKINSIFERIKNLKNFLSQSRRDFSNYEKNRNVVEEIVEVPQEVTREIQRPIEIITFDERTIKEIENKFARAYQVLDQWKIRYGELYEEKYTPEERYVQIDVEKKKFALNKVEIMKANETDVESLEKEIQRMNSIIVDFKNQINTVNRSLKEVIVKQKRIEVPKENIIPVEVETHVCQINPNAQNELRNELYMLKNAVIAKLKTPS